jgi:hypothetical protein
MCLGNSIFNKIGQLYMKTSHIFYHISLSPSSNNNKLFRQTLLRKAKHTFYIQQPFFSKILPFLCNVEKYCRAGQVTVNIVADAHCMLDT